MSAGVVATQMAIMFLFLFIGYGLTKRGHFSADTSRDLSFIIANICCPSMLLAGIFTAPAMTGRELLEGGIATVVIYIILILLGLLVGPLLDTCSVFLELSVINVRTAWPRYVSGFWVNLSQGVCTFLTMVIFGNPLLEKLERIKTKYGF